MTKNYDRTTVALLALFLGGLGIHKFYLGKSGVGWLYLLFCWSFIPALVGFFEAISFFTMTDERFNELYNTIEVKLSAEQEIKQTEKKNINYKIKKLELDEDYSAGKMSAEMYQFRFILP